MIRRYGSNHGTRRCALSRCIQMPEREHRPRQRAAPQLQAKPAKSASSMAVL
ncbi:MAG: hypothetical protein MZW92_29085 [Comamonadaceae bacterium]|nr:hypothetical protein [Comamonadaceae bacterium]